MQSTYSSYEDDADLADFVHLDALVDNLLDIAPESSSTSLNDAAERNHTDPMVVFLLASVAFSVVLTLVSGTYSYAL